MARAGRRRSAFRAEPVTAGIGEQTPRRSSRLVAAGSRGVLPPANGQVPEEVRQPDRKRAKPGILLRERPDVGRTVRWRCIAPSGRSLFKQRRQHIEEIVIRMSQGRNLVDTGAAVFPVARRMSDAHGRSLDSGCTPSGRVPATSIESRAILSPKWDRRIAMTGAPSKSPGAAQLVRCQPKASATIPRPATVTARRKPEAMNP